MIRKCILIVGSLAIIGLAGVGCGPPTYGSSRVSVKVDATPNKAFMYAIPEGIWSQKGGPDMLEDASLLAKYKIGTSPAKDDLKRNRRYVFVAERDGKYAWLEQTVSKDNSEFLLEFLE